MYLKRFIVGGAGIMLFMFMVGCGEKYETRYTFIPPKTESGAICANQCVTQKNECTQKCINNGTILDIGDKVISAFSTGSSSQNKAVDKCSSSCAEDHRICHTNCGGTVEAYKVCVAYCSDNS